MEKALILCFSVGYYDIDELYEMTSDGRYEIAKDGVEQGTADIYTLNEFCGTSNNGEDCFSELWIFPHYVNEEEYKYWMK